MIRPMVVKCGIYEIQVCVPRDWTYKEILDFAKKKFPKETWSIRSEP